MLRGKRKKSMEEKDKVEELLQEAKKELGADDARFRPVSWNDKPCVHVSGWIIGGPLALMETEPELFRRVYFDPDDPTRMDCIVGYVARIARIQQATKEMDWGLLRKLKQIGKKKNISKKEIKSPQYFFPEAKKERTVVQFIHRVEEKKKENEKFQRNWESYHTYLTGKRSESLEDFHNAVIANLPPSATNKKQWEGLWKYYKDHKKMSPEKVKEKFIEAVNKTAIYYQRLSTQWGKYEPILRGLGQEIAVPVVASDKLLGVLNFHKKEGKFTKNPKEAVDLAQRYAERIAAVFLLDLQIKMLEIIREIGESLAAQSKSEEIASKIAEGVRKSMIGLQLHDVYPLLYYSCCPIDKDDELTSFSRRWNHWEREKPQSNNQYQYKLWQKEKALFKIPIRGTGLGFEAIDEWRGKLKKGQPIAAKEYFRVAGDVDNPNSKNGSRSAYDKGIRTTGCLPLIFNQQVHGLLYVHCKKRHFFTQVELDALEILGILAAIAISNQRKMGSEQISSYEELYGSKLLDLLTGLKGSEDFD